MLDGHQRFRHGAHLGSESRQLRLRRVRCIGPAPSWDRGMLWHAAPSGTDCRDPQRRHRTGARVLWRGALMGLEQHTAMHAPRDVGPLRRRQGAVDRTADIGRMARACHASRDRACRRRRFAPRSRWRMEWPSRSRIAASRPSARSTGRATPGNHIGPLTPRFAVTAGC
jgi:hypothetical protein